MQLPGGFSPINAVKQVGSIINPTGGVADYDVFGNVSVRGGARSPSNGAWIGPQAQPAGATSQGSDTGNVSQADSTPVYGGQNGSVLGASTTSSAQSAADAAAKNAALLQIDQGLSQYNDALGRLDSQRATGLGNIGRDYQDSLNRLNASKKLAQNDYSNSLTDQLNQYQSARNQVATQGRGFMNSALRTLGMNGAGGGSAARYGVPYEAQQMVASGNAQAQGTNNHNVGALTANWNKAQNDFTNSQNDLQRQKQQGENDYNSKIENQRATLLNNIAQLTGQKTIANGGNYQAALAAANPYTSQIAGILNQIDSLAATPAIHEQAVTVGRPDLSGYNFSRINEPAAPVQDPTLQNNNTPIIDPYGQNQDQQDQVNPLLALFGLQNQQQDQSLVPVQ